MQVKLVNDNFKENYGENILKARGIKNVNNFMNPNEKNLQSWKDLDNIDKGIQIIDKALKNNYTIALIVDSDVDGYTSSSILYQYLKKLGIENIDYFLHDGKQHGLEDMWEKIEEKEYDLVILPDAGSNDSNYSEQLPCQILCIDHHIVEDEENIANNMTVINNQSSKKYKNKYLSGAGVVYQFCKALDKHYNKNWADNYLDLAALGICGDMMSGLEIENQYFWKRGFSEINNFFIKVLLEKQAYPITGKTGATLSDIIEEYNPTTAAFNVIPLINAMIRMGTQNEKDRLFLAFVDGEKMVPCNKRGAKGTLEKVAIESARECGNAKNHQDKMKDKVTNSLERKIIENNLLDNKILFIELDDDDDFPAVLNGLMAMKLSVDHKKPTIVARLNEEGYVRGSIRGLNNSSLTSFKDFLSNTNLFEYVQGHDNAAGCSIPKKKIPKLLDIANEKLKDLDFSEDCYEVNLVRDAQENDISDIVYDLEKYKNIWSQKNSEPLINVNDIYLNKVEIQTIGRNKDTLKFEKNGIVYIKFFAKDIIKKLEDYGDKIKINLVGSTNINEWCGTKTPQIMIKSLDIIEDDICTF